MNFSCDACQHRYSLPDEKVRGRTVRIRCRHCGHLTSITGPSAQPPAARAEWYAMVRGHQVGPFDLPGLLQRVHAGDVTPQSFVWRMGMEDWQRAHEVPALAQALFAPRAPAPSSPPAPPVRKEEAADPFAALGAPDPSSLPAPAESTMFFMHEAGVTRRNPRWKLPAFIAVGAGGVALIALVLTGLDRAPPGMRASGGAEDQVEQPVFVAEGSSELGDALLGREAPSGDEAAAKSVQRRRRRPAPKPDVPPAEEKASREEAPPREDLAALYADTARSDRGPRVRPTSVEATATKVTTGEGLSAEQMHKVVAASQRAFQACIESELRKNPNLRAPRFFIRATVAPSGAVTAASIDRREVDDSALGECLKSRARRMTFAPFEGEELVVEIPLIVGVAM